MFREWMNKPSLPHAFSLLMGQQIKQAREEKGWSQAYLAERIYKRRPAISEMENGKMIPSSDTLLMLAVALDKPLIYFYGEKYRHMLKEDDPKTVNEKELIVLFRHLLGDKQEIALSQIRALVALQEKD